MTGQYGSDQVKDIVLTSPAGQAGGKLGKPVSTPTVVKTTTKQVLTKNNDGVTHNVEEEVRNLGTGEVTYSTQEHKVSKGLYPPPVNRDSLLQIFDRIRFESLYPIL